MSAITREMKIKKIKRIIIVLLLPIFTYSIGAVFMTAIQNNCEGEPLNNLSFFVASALLGFLTVLLMKYIIKALGELFVYIVNYIND